MALADIEDVRLPEASFDPFFESGTLEVIAKGQVALTLHGVPEPEGFRRTILNACAAVGSRQGQNCLWRSSPPMQRSKKVHRNNGLARRSARLRHSHSSGPA